MARATLLSLSSVSKRYGATEVVRDATFSLNQGWRVGLVGPNGVGKSTLLKIVVGEEEADTGEVSIRSGIRVGYVPQSITVEAGLTVGDLIRKKLAKVYELQRRLRTLESMMSTDAAELDQILEEYGHVSLAFESLGGYEIDHKISLMTNGLSVANISHERMLTTLSGGEKARMVLAVTLLESPELLLLDEPTNHLDASSLEWLEAYLRGYRGAILMASHDRKLLNRVVEAIIEIDDYSKGIRRYTGDYDQYLRARRTERLKWEEKYALQRDEIRELREVVRSRGYAVGHGRSAPDRDKSAHSFRGERVQHTVSRNIRSAEEKLRRIDADPIPKPPTPLQINAEFDPGHLGTGIPIVVSHLTKSFETKLVLDDLNFEVKADNRTVIIGESGAGKSTLLRIMAGEVDPDSGTLILAPAARVGLLDQEQTTLPDDISLFDSYREGLTGTEEEITNRLMSHGLFKFEQMSRQIGQLSKGERRKLQIAKLIASRSNVLLLDEPTNHISFDVLEELETALRGFRGPVIAVSHDRRFIEHFAGDVRELSRGKLHPAAS